MFNFTNPFRRRHPNAPPRGVPMPAACSAPALAYRRHESGDLVEVAAALHAEVVEWSDADATRACVEHLDCASRAYALLVQIEAACAEAARTAEPALAVVSYYCRHHRGNPRRVRVRVTPHYEAFGEIRFTVDFA